MFLIAKSSRTLALLGKSNVLHLKIYTCEYLYGDNWMGLYSVKSYWVIAQANDFSAWSRNLFWCVDAAVSDVQAPPTCASVPRHSLAN